MTLNCGENGQEEDRDISVVDNHLLFWEIRPTFALYPQAASGFIVSFWIK
jgi:hypothetical protein